MTSFTIMLKSPGYSLRPLTWKDVHDVATVIFGDPEVAKTLAHDASTTESQRKCAEIWCERHAIDSAHSKWSEEKLGAWALVENREDESGERFVGLRGFNLDRNLPERCVSTFVALARSHWGRGLASQVTSALLDYVFENTDIQAVYTEIWPLLNPRSEAIQRKLGYELDGRHSVREAHGEDRMRQIVEFELWRASHASGPSFQRVLSEVSIKMGQLAAEALHSRDAAVNLVLEKVEGPGQATVELVRKNVHLGYKNPAWLAYRLQRSRWLDRNGAR